MMGPGAGGVWEASMPAARGTVGVRIQRVVRGCVCTCVPVPIDMLEKERSFPPTLADVLDQAHARGVPGPESPLPRKAELKLNFEPKLHLCVDGSGSGNAEEQAGAASRQESAAGDAPAPACKNLCLGELDMQVMHLHQHKKTIAWEKLICR